MPRSTEAQRARANGRGAQPASRSTDGRVVYAIGDVHGRFDLLLVLLRRVWADAARSRGAALPVVVLLGDYVDRGPESRQVLDLIIATRGARDVETRCLMGNHEEALLRFIDDAAFGPTWHEYGAAATLTSYGVVSPARDAPPSHWERARREFEAALPASHLRLLKALEPICMIGDFAFVHAGIRPGVPLEAQQARDLLWIREPFLESLEPFEKVIVHGHTPLEEPFDGAHRIGVDTGAYATSVLTCVRLEGDARSFLQVRSRDLSEERL